VTADPWSLVSQGWVCTEVVGFVTGPGSDDEMRALAERGARAREATKSSDLRRLAANADRRALRPAVALAARASSRLKPGRSGP
jgi:hypothetical protein